MKKQIDMTKDNLDKILLIIVFPVIITNVIDGLYGLIDGLFVANLGDNAVASVTFVGPIQDTLNAICTGLSLAGCSLIAKYIGAKNLGNAEKMTGQLVTIGVGIGVIISIISFIFCEQILVISGITQALLEDSSHYLRLISWSIVCNFITVIYLAIERANGNTKQAMRLNFCSITLKIFFSWLLTMIFELGITGIGIATILSKGICAVIAIIVMFNPKKERFIAINHLTIDIPLSKILIITSLPLVFEKSLTSFGFVLVNKNVLAFGEDVLAAYGLTNKVNASFFNAVAAFGLGVSVIIAQNIGAKEYIRAEKAIWKTIFYVTIFSTACAIGVVLLRYPIANLFTDPSKSTYHHMIDAITIYSTSVIPWAITECSLGVFQGTGYTVYNLIISLVRIYVLRLPIVIILSMPIWNLGAHSIWYAMLYSNILSAVFAFGLVLFLRKKVIYQAKEK